MLGLSLEGLDGRAVTRTVHTRTTPPLPTWTITEIRSDSVGPEPAQEYVELVNFGGVAMRPAGLTLADAPDRLGDLIESPVTIAPGGRLLVVAQDFDPDRPDDQQPPAGIPIVRVDGPLASGGLSNGGEPLYLRDGDGRRISSAPALPSSGPGSCLRRVSDAPRTGAPGAFTVSSRCTPGEAEPLEAW